MTWAAFAWPSTRPKRRSANNRLLEEAVRAKGDATTAVSRVALGKTPLDEATPEEVDETLAEARNAIRRAREIITRIQAERDRNAVVRAEAEALVEYSKSLQPDHDPSR